MLKPIYFPPPAIEKSASNVWSWNSNDEYEFQSEMNGSSRLHIACEYKQHEAILHYLQLGDDPNVQRKDGDSPLHLASSKADWDAMHLLLDHGAKLNLRNQEGDTSLHRIAQLHKMPLELFKRCLKQGMIQNIEDMHFIQILVYHHSWSLLEVFLEQLPLPSIHLVAYLKDILKEVLLCEIDSAQKLQLVKTLIQYQAPVHKSSTFNFLQIALEEKAWDIMWYFLDITYSVSKQILVSQNVWGLILEQKQLRLLKILLEITQTPNTTVDPFGNTLLHKAVHTNHQGSVKELLLWGADSTLKNDRGLTAEKYADLYMKNHILSIHDTIETVRCRYQFQDITETLQWLRLNTSSKWFKLALDSKRWIKFNQTQDTSSLQSITQLPLEIHLIILEKLAGFPLINIPDTTAYWRYKESTKEKKPGVNTLSSSSKLSG
jgi:ankyrin repeat protein